MVTDEYVGKKQDRIDDRDSGKTPLVLGEHYTVEDEVISGTLIAKDAAAALKDAVCCLPNSRFALHASSAILTDLRPSRKCRPPRLTKS